MELLFWILIIASFIIAFLALIYPIIPGVIFLILGFVLYGVFFSFDAFTWFFWSIQIMLLILLFVADYLGNYIGVKKYGGSKAAIWGSTIGLIIGPFIIPIIGLIIGPFVGAIIAELLVHRKPFVDSVKIGFGSVIGFFSSVLMKTIVQIAMITYFFTMVL